MKVIVSFFLLMGFSSESTIFYTVSNVTVKHLSDVYLEFGFRYGYVSYISVHLVHSAITEVY